MKIQKHVKVELLRKKAARPIEAVQFDTGNQIIFELIDFELPTGTTATLYIQKPSGKFVYQEDGIAIADNEITVDLHNQALTEHGKVYYQVRLENGADLITTFTGIMFVEKSLADAGATESRTVLAAFAELTAEKIAEIQAAAAQELADQLADIQQKSEDEQEAIRNTGAAVLATIPADYTETHAMAEDAVRTKADGIVCSAEGELITVSDSSDMPLQGLKLLGKTEQVKTTGVQLLDYINKATVDNGHYAADDTGVISQLAVDSRSVANIPVSQHLEAGSYTARIVEILSSGNILTNLQIFNATTGAEVLKTSYTEAGTFTLTDDADIAFKVYNAEHNCKAKVMLNTGDVALPFEPYTGGKPTPSPDYPQDLVSVGEAGSVGVKVRGKNLFNADINNPVKVSYIKSDGTVSTRKGYEITLPVGTYTASVPGVTAVVNQYMYGCVCGNDGVYKTRVNLLANTAVNVVTFDIANGDKLLLFSGDSTATVDSVIKLFTENPVQIEHGSVATAYEVPSVQTLAAQTPNGLAGIPVSSGGNYTDKTGQRWVCDEIDFERNMYVKRIGVVENYSGETIATTYVSSTGALTAGAYIQYILATPIETPLSAEEIAAFRALHSNCPNTTIYNDGGADMEVKYAADTKLYIDNKFAALAAAMVNNA